MSFANKKMLRKCLPVKNLIRLGRPLGINQFAPSIHSNAGHQYRFYSSDSQQERKKSFNKHEFRKKLISYAILVSISAPMLMVLLSRYSLNQLTSEEQALWDDIENQVDLAPFIDDAIESVKKDGRYTLLETNKSKIGLDKRQTKSLAVKVSIDDEPSSGLQLYFMKGILFLYIPITTQKGAMFIRSTLVSDVKNKKLYPYKVELSSIALEKQMGQAFVPHEEDNLTITEITVEQLQELFNVDGELKCAKISTPNHLLEIKRETRPILTHSYMYEFTDGGHVMKIVRC